MQNMSSDEDEEKRISDWKDQLAQEMSSEDEETGHGETARESARESVRESGRGSFRGSQSGQTTQRSSVGRQGSTKSIGRRSSHESEHQGYEEPEPASPTKKHFRPPARDMSPVKSGGLGSLHDPDVPALKQQLREVIKKCDEKDKELARLRDMEMALKDIETLDTSQQRVVDLAKRNRNLTVALEKERTKNAKLVQETVAARADADAVKAAHSKDRVASRKKTRKDDDSDAGGGSGDPKETRELKVRVDELQLKLVEARTENHKFKQDLQKAHRALVKEVGEDVPLYKVLDEGAGGWKGRAQLIAILKNKVKEAQRSGGGAQTQQSEYIDPDDYNRDNLDALKMQRQTQIQDLQTALRQKEEDMKDLKLKSDGLHSRITSLANDNKRFRDKIKVLLDKSNNDDALISAFKEEISKRNGSSAGQKTNRSSGPKLDESERYELDRLKLVTREQEAQIDRQEQIVMALRAELQKLTTGPDNGGVMAEPAQPRTQRPHLRVKK